MSRLRAAYLAGDSMGKFENIIGRRFGRLTVISDEGTDGHYHYWRCQCDCGKEIVARTASLKNGNTKSCGCIRVDIAKKARENQKFNSEVSSFIQHDRVDGTRISTLKRKSVRADNSSGCTGVNWDKNRSMWNVRIYLKGKYICVGRFQKLDEAIAARKAAEDKYYKPIIDKYEEEHNGREDK
jgi:hypothetical protein